MLTARFIFLGTLAFFGLAAFAADDVPFRGRTLRENRGAETRPSRLVLVKPKPKKVANRAPSSSPYSSLRATGEKPGKAKDWRLDIGILGGFATTSTNDAAAQSLRNAGGFSNNGYFGALIDLKIQKWLGFEAEGFYNFAPSTTVNSVDLVSSTIKSEERRLRQYGVMTNAKGRLPFRLGSVRIEPFLGAGFGLLGVTETSASATTGAASQTSTELNGLYGSGGIAVEPVSGFVLSADYARSLSAGGDRTVNGVATTVQNARFERVRAGALVRIEDPFYIGAQYVGRRMRFDLPGTSGASEEIMNQYLGVLLLGL